MARLIALLGACALWRAARAVSVATASTCLVCTSGGGGGAPPLPPGAAVAGAAPSTCALAAGAGVLTGWAIGAAAPSYTISDASGALYVSAAAADGPGLPMVGGGGSGGGGPPMAVFPAGGVAYAGGLFLQLSASAAQGYNPYAAPRSCNVTVVVYTAAAGA